MGPDRRVLLETDSDSLAILDEDFLASANSRVHEIRIRLGSLLHVHLLLLINVIRNLTLDFIGGLLLGGHALTGGAVSGLQVT